MKPSPFPMLLALLMVPWAWGLAAGRQAPGVMPRSHCDVVGCDSADAAPGACGSCWEYQKVKPGLEFPWILAYVPIRSCHRVLKGKYGELSPPAYRGDSPINFWCNWTIWAGSRKHIIIYIQGFITKDSCNKNEDKILFEGVSSLVENSVVYACWKKEMYVFATFAQAVHVVLLKRYLPNCRETQFKGKYYIFQDQEGESSSRDDVISETPAPKLLKQDTFFQSRWSEDLRDVLGFVMTTHSTVSHGKTTVLSGGLLWRRGTALGTTAFGSSVELVPYDSARTQLLETKAPFVLGSEMQGGLKHCKEAQGRGTPGDLIPTAVPDAWGQSHSVSGDVTMGFDYLHRISSVLLETPLLDALQVVEPFLQLAGVGLENSQSVLHPTLRLKDLGDLQFTIKPTHTNCLDLAARLQSFSTGRRESKETTDTTVYWKVSTVSLEKDESHPQLSVLAGGTVSSDADSLAKGLMPSLSSPYEVVNRDHLHLLPERSQRCQSSFGDLSVTQPELETTGIQYTKLMSIFHMESFREVAEEKTVLHPVAQWDVLQEHPHLHGQSSHVLQSAPVDAGSLPQNAQAHNCPAAGKACASSLSVKSRHYQSDRAAQLRLVTPPLPTGLKHPPAVMPALGTETTRTLMVSCAEPVPADFGSTDFTPEAHLPLEVGPLSRVIPLPAALDLDPVSFRQRASISPASPGEQETVSPSPPCHPSVDSELGTDGSPGGLGPGMPKLVLEEADGQRGETSASVGLTTRGSSPASATAPRPGVGLPHPEDRMSSSSGVAPASLPGTWGVRRGEHMLPMQHQGVAASDKLASDSNLGGFKMQRTAEALQVDAEEQKNAFSTIAPVHPGLPVAWWGETVSRGQKPQKPSDDPVSRTTQMPGGQQQKRAELGTPWAMEYFPVSNCHLVFQDRSGMFYLPLHADIKTNIWCNWTIWAGPQQHIVIYIQGFQGSEGCSKNQDKIIFQGVSSSVENKVVYACHNRGTLIFATQATAVHVLFLSGSGSLSSEYGHFKGQYYIFRDSETVVSSNDATAPQKPVQEVSKKESWRTVVTKGLLPMMRASPGPSAAPAGGTIKPELVSPNEEVQHSPNLMEDPQSSANLSKLDLSEHSQLQGETKLERSFTDGGTEGRETKDGVLMEAAPAGQDAGRKAEPSALEIAKWGVEPVSTLVTTVPCRSVGVSSSEAPSSNVGVSAKSSILDQASNSLSEEVVAAVHHMQAPVLEEPLLNMSTKPSFYPFPAVTAGDTVHLGERNEKLLDLVSALVSLENDTALQSQHHPGDVLFEVTIEIKPKDWILHGGSELQKSRLDSMKSRIHENLKLSANRVNEIKLKEVKRMSNTNLLLTFWLHLKPEERNVSLLLRSQLEELLGTSVGVEKLQLVSLSVEDVNECSTGVGLCGDEAECFNGVGTYLCRCKKGYEDHSPTKSGTLCIPAPGSGIGFFLRHADILVGAAITAGLAMLVAAGALCRASRRGRQPRRNPSPEEPPVRAVEEPAMELHDLEECLRLDPFQMKLRARPPEWLWGARVHPGRAYQVFLEQSPPL